MVKGKIVPMLN